MDRPKPKKRKRRKALNTNKFSIPENYDKIADLSDGKQLWAGANDWEDGWSAAWIQAPKEFPRWNGEPPEKFLMLDHKECPACHGKNDTSESDKATGRDCRDWAKKQVMAWAKPKKRQPKRKKGLYSPFTKSLGPHKYGCAMFDLATGGGYTRTQGAIAPYILRMAAKIAPEDLSGEANDRPHITLLYGFLGGEPTPVADLVSDFGAVPITLGKTAIFQNPDADVLYVEVESPEIHRLNALLRTLPHKETHPEYIPHVCVAYLKPGAGSKYVGMTDAVALTMGMNRMVFSAPDKTKTEIPICTYGMDRSTDEGMQAYLDRRRIEAMADILGGCFGWKGVSIFGKDKAEKHLHHVCKGWNKLDHPRGPNGRFIPKNSPEAHAAAKTAIERALHGRQNTESHRSLVEHLAILSTGQLHALKKEYGLSASAEDKPKLVAKIADRLNKGRRNERAEPEPMSIAPEVEAVPEIVTDPITAPVTDAVHELTGPSTRDVNRPVVDAIEALKPQPIAQPIKDATRQTADPPVAPDPRIIPTATGKPADPSKEPRGPVSPVDTAKGSPDAQKPFTTTYADYLRDVGKSDTPTNRWGHERLVKEAQAYGQPIADAILDEYPHLRAKPQVALDEKLRANRGGIPSNADISGHKRTSADFVRTSREVHVSGATFRHKDAIRHAGGAWDKAKGVWIVTPTGAAKLAKLPGLTFGGPGKAKRLGGMKSPFRCKRITAGV